MLARRCILCLLLKVCFCCCVGQKIPLRANIFYVSVGSSHYDSNPAFEFLPSAKNSAQRFSQYMKTFDAFGITETSTSKRRITKAIIINAINVVVDSMKKSKHWPNILFVYLCGHGFADLSTQLQFFVTGNINYDVHFPENAQRIRDDMFSFHDLTQIVINGKIHEVCLIFDCCYEMRSTNPTYYSVEREMRRRDTTWPDSLKNTLGFFMVDPKDNRGRASYHDQTNYFTIVYATSPGKSVETVIDPLARKRKLRLGPVCRRILLLDAKYGASGPLLYSTVLNGLSDPELDYESDIPVVKVKDRGWGEIEMVKKQNKFRQSKK